MHVPYPTSECTNPLQWDPIHDWSFKGITQKSHLLSETKQCSNVLQKSSFLTHKDQVGCLNVYIQCTMWWWWGCHPTAPRIVDIIDEVISLDHRGHVKVIHNSYAGVQQSRQHGSKLHWMLYLVSLTHYLELRVAITIYCISHFPPMNAKSVVWTL